MVESTVDVADWSSGALSIEVSKRFIYIVLNYLWLMRYYHFLLMILLFC